MKTPKAFLLEWVASVCQTPAKLIKRYVHDLNMIFNSLPQRKRKIVAVAVGTLIAVLIVMLMMRWVSAATPFIALPEKIHSMNATRSQRGQPSALMPLGRFVSRSDNSKICFTVAVSMNGEFRIASENDSIWKPITTSGLQQLEMNYKFLPVTYDTTENKLINQNTQP